MALTRCPNHDLRSVRARGGHAAVCNVDDLFGSRVDEVIDAQADFEGESGEEGTGFGVGHFVVDCLG